MWFDRILFQNTPDGWFGKFGQSIWLVVKGDEVFSKGDASRGRSKRDRVKLKESGIFAKLCKIRQSVD